MVIRRQICGWYKHTGLSRILLARVARHYPCPHVLQERTYKKSDFNPQARFYVTMQSGIREARVGYSQRTSTTVKTCIIGKTCVKAEIITSFPDTRCTETSIGFREDIKKYLTIAIIPQYIYNTSSKLLIF